MPRPIWKGLVNFGLVNVPVELHSAVRDHAPHFRLLHRTDLSPISMERVCQKDGHPVAWADLVKGYEIEPGRFVTVTQDDFKTAAMERSRSIDILGFVPAKDIDVRFWDTPYLARPSRGAEHSYALLAAALAESDRVGIAKYVMRQRQHLAALTALRGQLLVSTMRFSEDLLSLPDAPTPRISAKELGLAAKLIEGMAETWDPSRYADDYVPKLMQVIRAKAKGATASRPVLGRQQETKVVDLVARLQQSLADAAKTKKAGRAGRKASAQKAVKKLRRTSGKPTAA